MLSDKKLNKLKQKYMPVIKKFKLAHKWKEAVELLYSDPAKGEYSKWMLSQLKAGHSVEDIIPTVKYYHDNRNKFDNLSKYKDVKELENIVKGFESKKQQDVFVKDSERTPIWSNDEYFLVRINSKNASVKYGKGTRWCITMQGASYYEQYKAHNIVFYFLLPRGSGEKYAFSIKRGIDEKVAEIEIFDSADNVVATAPFLSEYRDKMISDAEQQPETEFSRIAKGTASKEDLGNFLDVYIDNYKQAIESDDSDAIENALDAIENVSPFLNEYPVAVSFYKKKYPELDNLKVNISEDISPELLVYFANNDDVFVRREVAGNPNTPPEILVQFANDNDKFIRQSVASNPNTPPETLAQLANDNDKLIRHNVANNPNTPPEILAQLANDDYHFIRYNVAINPNTPPEILAQFANDNDKFIRQSVAGNPNTPPEILVQLVNDNDKLIRRNVASNPNTPPEILVRLANDQERDIRQSVAINPNTPPEILAQLANDDYYFVRHNVASNPNTPPEILAQFANDNDKFIRQSVAGNPNTPPETLAQLANAQEDGIRQNVFNNPNTPPEILVQLANMRHIAPVERKVPLAEQYYRKLPDFPMYQDMDEAKEIAWRTSNQDMVNQLFRLDDPEINNLLLQNPSVSEDIKQKIRQEQYHEQYSDQYEKIAALLSMARVFYNMVKNV